MLLGIQGLKCKKHLKKLTKKKRSAQNSLFHPRELRIHETQRAKSSYYSSAPRTIETSKQHNDIIFSSDLPSLPLYMPKLIKRGQLQMKSLNKSLIPNTRLNVFSPYKSNTTEYELLDTTKDICIKMLSKSPIFPKLSSKKYKFDNKES